MRDIYFTNKWQKLFPGKISQIDEGCFLNFLNFFNEYKDSSNISEENENENENENTSNMGV
jgi:hypothetical protein